MEANLESKEKSKEKELIVVLKEIEELQEKAEKIKQSK